MSSDKRSASHWQANHVIIDILERSKLQDDFIFENIRGVCAVIDLSGNIYKANIELAQIFNVPIYQIKQKSFNTLFSEASWIKLQNKLLALDNKKAHPTFEVVTDGLPPEQQKTYLLELYYYGKYKNLDLDFFFILGTDISELRNTEKKLKDQYEENKKLVRIITHDLASPMTVIEFVSRQMLKEKVDLPSLSRRLSRSFETIKEILVSVRNLQSIIDGIKKINLNIHSVDQLISETIVLFAERLNEKQISIDFNPALLNAYIEVNTLRNQILSNLISNAIKFTYSGQTIYITSFETPNHIVISIKDSGVGIKPDVIPNLFTISKNISTEGTSGEKGTGYGLPICKSILELMGGDIQVESQHIGDFPNNHGTTFYVYLQKAKSSRSA
jgi:signal transduction histidine kinase